MRGLLVFCFLMTLFVSTAFARGEGISASALSNKEDQPGFLVVAMDRGALGNKEIEAVSERFGQEYPATMTLIGWNEEKYKPYFISSLKGLKAKGVKRVVVIPMLVSRHDPYFEKMEGVVNATAREVFGQEYYNPVITPPLGETILLLSNGSADDQVNERWLSMMLKNAGHMERLSKKRFRSVKVATLREDWPDKMEVSLQEIRKIIEDGNREGRVIVIPNRLAGSGPYQRVLQGMKYDINPNGIAPHPFVTRWLEREIQKVMGNLDMSLPIGEISGADGAVIETTRDGHIHGSTHRGRGL